MNRLAITLFVLTVVGAIALLGMSFWPGLLSDAIFLGILLGTIPLAALLFIAVVVAAIEQIVKRTGALVNVLPGGGEVDSRAFADAGVARISYGAGPWFAAMAWLQEQARSAIDWKG